MFFNCRLFKAFRTVCLGLGAAAALAAPLRAELSESGGSGCLNGGGAYMADASGSAGQTKDLRSLRAEGIKAYARLQVLIEYYFMQSGRYPHSLESLEKSFNAGLPKDAPRVALGNEPASGLPFIYEPVRDYCSYTLKMPKPELYAEYLPALSNIDWAWLRFAAEGKRVERLAVQCTENIEALATRCELYAKDHNKAYPANLAALKPVYMPRELFCPVDGKPYVYILNKGGYTISCPSPNGHGLGNFTYNSEKGLQIEELKTE
ncbi:hypothetical protein IJT93_00650 [bacterium]|nr:hypothetical protein [bacterium]